MTAQTRYHAGLAAEQNVARDYERRGRQIASHRWRGAGGEVDLIVRDGDTLIFVEVKKSASHARAASRVSRRQMNRIYAAASEYIGDEPLGQLTDVRFDVATVDQFGAVQIIENAFMAA
ncbi:YraN family protein [Yoonia sp. 208BN28-4]|uniref:YraN family protein n=1 Tax=Yoonia sp. 208BN28-4 TaxID=3126505 RepID=UPI0030954275